MKIQMIIRAPDKGQTSFSRDYYHIVLTKESTAGWIRLEVAPGCMIATTYDRIFTWKKYTEFIGLGQYCQVRNLFAYVNKKGFNEHA